MGQSHTYLPLLQPPLLSQMIKSQSLRLSSPARLCAQGTMAIAATCTFLAAGSFPGLSARAASSVLTRSAIHNSVDPRLLRPDLLAQVTYPTLSAGSAGASVSRLQATLKLLGFYQGAVDGIYAQATQAAVGRFQSAAGITADGITGPSTWAKLLPSPDAVTASEQAQDPSEASGSPTASEPATPPLASESAAAPTNVPPVLRLHAEGSAVSQLQRELQTLGYYSGTIDGVYGEQTQAAVTRFQTDKQLTVDGIVGASTWNALSRALAQPAG